MKRLLEIILLLYTGCCSFAQPTAGTTGLLNCPSAEMPLDGTFTAGANYLPDNVTHQPKFNYNTFNYYVGMAFLPFMELSFKMIMFRNPDDGLLRNQDRSLALRVRVLKEKKLLPSVVIGGNDIYSTVSSGNRYFRSLYIAGTKTFYLRGHLAGISVGYAPGKLSNSTFSGLFGGISFSPAFFRSLTIIADYDTKYLDAGASLLLFRHFYLYGFVSDLRQFAGGIAFRLYPKGTRMEASFLSNPLSGVN